MRRASFWGYSVDNLTMEEVLSWIEHYGLSRKSRIIAVINANKLYQSYRNPKLSNFLKSADLILPEYAIVWGAKKLGIHLTHLGGIMLLKAFLPFAEKKGIRPYFLGAKPDVVMMMVTKIKENFPDLIISGFHHGYLMDADVKRMVFEDINRKNPDILFVAMGSPKQEYLMNEIKDSLSVPLLMGVGGSFDVLSGNKRDAPPWVRSKGFEWLYRVFQEPQNSEYWKRYLITNTWFVWQVMKTKYFVQRP